MPLKRPAAEDDEISRQRQRNDERRRETEQDRQCEQRDRPSQKSAILEYLKEAQAKKGEAAQAAAAQPVGGDSGGGSMTPAERLLAEASAFKAALADAVPADDGTSPAGDAITGAGTPSPRPAEDPPDGPSSDARPGMPPKSRWQDSEEEEEEEQEQVRGEPAGRQAGASAAGAAEAGSAAGLESAPAATAALVPDAPAPDGGSLLSRSRWLETESEEEDSGRPAADAQPRRPTSSADAPSPVGGSAQARAGAEEAGGGGGASPAFVPAGSFAGAREGFSFQAGKHGLGYYAESAAGGCAAAAGASGAGGSSTGGGDGAAGCGPLVVPETRVASAASTSAAGAPGGGHVEACVGGAAGGAAGLAWFRPCRNVDLFEKLHKIDEGTYGVVYKARDTTSGDVVALKQVKLLNTREGFPTTALREINVLLFLKHESIVNVREMVVGSRDKIFMVMDYMEHDLKGLMSAMPQPFTASEVKRLMVDLTSALAHCHEHFVLHRDLKTSNLLINNRGRVCIADFGLARMYADPLREYTQPVVTLWYRAPELLLGAAIYGPAVDVWSLGCIFAEMVLGSPLLPGKGELDQISKTFTLLGTPNDERWPGAASLPNFKKVNFRPQPFSRLRDKFTRGASFTSSTAMSDSGLDLLQRMLCLDPDERISAAAAHKHEYFGEDPPPKAHHLMPTWPASHAGKPKPKVRSVDPEEEEQRMLFHSNRDDD